MRTRRPEDGFTLVELMVVMVVLGVLAGIAIPVFVGQKSKAVAAAMRSDLRSVVVAEASWATKHPAPTADPADLAAEGYRASDGVSTPHVVVTASTYVACVTHPGVGWWLVFDSATGSYSESETDCA